MLDVIKTAYIRSNITANNRIIIRYKTANNLCYEHKKKTNVNVLWKTNKTNKLTLL